ncbi:MAG: hypothetical protein AAFX58_05710, partial [Pseudomonadota bacterium]
AGIDGVTLSGKIIAAGHSFGGLIAQIAAGAELDPAVDAALSETAIRPLAVIALSPPGPIPDYISAAGWGKLRTPSLTVTGTADIIPEFTPKWELHKASYEAAPAGGAYLLVFDGMDHYFNGAFGRRGAQGFEENSAVVLLNGIILDFVRSVETGSLPIDSEWTALSSDALLAESR